MLWVGLANNDYNGDNRCVLLNVYVCVRDKTMLLIKILEEKIESGLMLIVAKGMIFATLIPVEIIGSRLAERNLTESGKINESIYRDLLLSAYEDGIITDMERNLLQSSARQLGINKVRASHIEKEFAENYD